MVITWLEFLKCFVPKYEESYKEQEQECESIVSCSCSENGMNPDALAAQGLMMKFEEDCLFESLKNYSKEIIKEYKIFVNQNVKQGIGCSFEDFWTIRGGKFVRKLIEENNGKS